MGILDGDCWLISRHQAVNGEVTLRHEHAETYRDIRPGEGCVEEGRNRRGV